jgi:arsenite methyltransferase
MKNTTDLVKEKYGDTAQSGLSSSHAGVRAVAQAFGYSAEELASIPAEANMGLSCGNPLATAHLKEGEVVVDLGSGGGLDVFLAARQVGPSGKAIGIDMTPEMLELARANAAKGGYQNVEFLEGQIDALPLPDGSADLVISNCVVNLAPDKNKVFREIHRVLKPGGRVAISDIALKQELPDELAQSAAALVGCIAGAITIKEYEEGLKAAGFSEVAVIDSGADLTAYAQVEAASACCSVLPAPAASSGCCSPAPAPSSGCCAPAASSKPIHADLGELMRKYDVNAYAASVKVLAVKFSDARVDSRAP